jgi:hypothetical protein
MCAGCGRRPVAGAGKKPCKQGLAPGRRSGRLQRTCPLLARWRLRQYTSAPVLLPGLALRCEAAVRGSPRGFGSGAGRRELRLQQGLARLGVEEVKPPRIDGGSRSRVVPRLSCVASVDNGWLYAATYTLVSVSCSGRSSLQATNGFVEPSLTLSQAAATYGSGLLIRGSQVRILPGAYKIPANRHRLLPEL